MITSYLRNPARAVTFTWITAILLAIASLGGLLFPGTFYPTEDLRRTFLANDVVNLVVGMPVLLGSMWLARRGSLLGVLFWPGGLFFVTYNSIAYTFAMPLTLSFVLNLALILLSIYAIYDLLSGLDGEAVQSQLIGSVPERFIGAVLVVLGILFFLMAAGGIVNFMAGRAAVSWAELSVQIADFLVTPLWVVGGILLWRKHVLGYVSGVGLLFQVSMLFVGLLAFFILLPFVAEAPFPAEDFIVVAVMSLIGFAPLGFFVRGILRKPRRD